jgi:hypothetical protein
MYIYICVCYYYYYFIIIHMYIYILLYTHNTKIINWFRHHHLDSLELKSFYQKAVATPLGVTLLNYLGVGAGKSNNYSKEPIKA